MLDECVASGALVASADSLRFRHELARAAIESSLCRSTAGGRMNGAVLDVLVERGDVDDARLAHHAELAEDAAGGAALRTARGRAGRPPGFAPRVRSAVRAGAAVGGRRRPRPSSRRCATELADEYGLLDQWERSAELRERAAASLEGARATGDARALRCESSRTPEWRLCDGEANVRLVGRGDRRARR